MLDVLRMVMVSDAQAVADELSELGGDPADWLRRIKEARTDPHLRAAHAAGRSQIDSSIREGKFLAHDHRESPLEMVFIRAPKIEHIGQGVEVIATEGNDNAPVAVRQGRVMAATFHPELSDDPRVHQAFLDLVSRL